LANARDIDFCAAAEKVSQGRSRHRLTSGAGVESNFAFYAGMLVVAGARFKISAKRE
jgi:hypothetical protein